MSFEEIRNRYKPQIEQKVPGRKYYKTIITRKDGKSVVIQERISYNEFCKLRLKEAKEEEAREEREYQQQEEERLERLFWSQFNRPSRRPDPFREGLDIPGSFYEGLNIDL